MMDAKLRRDMIMRSIGQIEGVGMMVSDKIRDALYCAIDILEVVASSLEEDETTDGK
jgi:hypothetical protein